VTFGEIVERLAGAPVVKKAISAPEALNEAYHYPRPSSFSRGIRVELNDIVILFISGTASVNERGESVHIGDFRAQTRRTFYNITALLASEGASWKDVVRTTCQPNFHSPSDQTRRSTPLNTSADGTTLGTIVAQGALTMTTASERCLPRSSGHPDLVQH